MNTMKDILKVMKEVSEFLKQPYPTADDKHRIQSRLDEAIIELEEIEKT